MTGEGFSLELASGAATALSGLPVACACLHGGRVVFSDGVALYRVGGDSDDGAAIPVGLTLAPMVCPGPAPGSRTPGRPPGGTARFRRWPDGNAVRRRADQRRFPDA